MPDDFDGIVYDVGGGMFDHHSEPRECRPNGVPYAAFGLLWRVVGAQLVGEHQARLMDENFIQPLDLNDNTGEQNSLADAREVGAKMLVLPDGRSVGSVGGGIMEYRVQQLASKMQAGEAAPCQLAEYSASAKEDDAALAACGGSMNVFLQLLKEEENNEA